MLNPIPSAVVEAIMAIRLCAAPLRVARVRFPMVYFVDLLRIPES